MCSLLSSMAGAQANTPQALESKKFSINNIPFTAEIANTNETRSKGLMFRHRLDPQHGMLFVFEQSQLLCFWMRNTYIPLSIAFINEQGEILNFHEMQPLRDDAHCSAGPAKYALEMNRHWFSKNNIKEQDIIKLLPN
ncbi:MAG: DUF192 domain-containing protein [Alcaligenaceae bacterium]|nr:DUF192 domain-containing protein [Alcaligenaceae bacterium]